MPLDLPDAQRLDAEKDNTVSTFQSILAGVGSGLIQIPKGAFSLGATLYDLGAGTNKAAEIEKYFDDLTELDEEAEATTAGKITQALVNQVAYMTSLFSSHASIIKDWFLYQITFSICSVKT